MGNRATAVDLLVTGAYGQLGKAVHDAARSRGLEVAGHDLDTLDITNPAAVKQRVQELAPRAVINCAAFTAVDACEEQEELATTINGDAAGYLADACNRSGSLLVQISTDYVFPGTGSRPYREDDPIDPVNAYGRSKLVGETRAAEAREVLILRTAWLCGRGGANFVEAIRRQIDAGRDELTVVADQAGCPTFCDDLARMILDLIQREARGVVHAVNSGSTTWHGFAFEIVRLLSAEVRVLPVTTDAYRRPAPRPAYSVLDTCKLAALLGTAPPSWQDGLRRYLEEPTSCES